MGGAETPLTKLITTMLTQNLSTFDARNQSETILKLEIESITLECEIFTASLDLESAQVLAERSIAFSDKFKNDAQRKAALATHLQTQAFLDKRRSLANLRFQKAHKEAQAAAAKRLFNLHLAQLQCNN